MSALCSGNTQANTWAPPFHDAVNPGIEIHGPVTLCAGNTSVFVPAAGPDFGVLTSGINVA
jgi:hypothetical protein